MYPRDRLFWQNVAVSAKKNTLTFRNHQNNMDCNVTPLHFCFVVSSTFEVQDSGHFCILSKWHQDILFRSQKSLIVLTLLLHIGLSKLKWAWTHGSTCVSKSENHTACLLQFCVVDHPNSVPTPLSFALLELQKKTVLLNLLGQTAPKNPPFLTGYLS